MTRGSGRLKEFRGVFILRFAQIYVDPPCAIDLNPKSAYVIESWRAGFYGDDKQ